MRWNWIPEAGSKLWWGYAGISTVLVSVILWLIRFSALGQTLTLAFVLRFILLALILSAVFSFAGWLGARRVWLCSNIGLLLGLALMAKYSRDMTGWGDLVGLLAFLQLTVGGFLLGLVIEIIYFIVRRIKRSL